MGRFLLVVVLAGAAGAQTLTEYGAAAATGAVGSAAGKKVSDGITNVFGKVDQQTKAAAKKDQAKPSTSDASKTPSVPSVPGPPPSPASGPVAASTHAAKSAPAAKASEAKAAAKAEPSARVTRTRRPEPPISVPDPPPLPTPRAVMVSKPAPAPKPVVEIAPALPPPPPPREATAEDLKAIAPGTGREDVLKLGTPASKISMVDDGRLLEIYTYSARSMTFGVVRLSDGAVSRVDLR
jgi:hypothetical protein